MEAEFWFLIDDQVARAYEGENYVDPCPNMDPFARYWCMVGKGWENFFGWEGWELLEPVVDAVITSANNF